MPSSSRLERRFQLRPFPLNQTSEPFVLYVLLCDCTGVADPSAIPCPGRGCDSPLEWDLLFWWGSIVRAVAGAATDKRFKSSLQILFNMRVGSVIVYSDVECSD
jgi:hypothetical protein